MQLKTLVSLRMISNLKLKGEQKNSCCCPNIRLDRVEIHIPQAETSRSQKDSNYKVQSRLWLAFFNDTCVPFPHSFIRHLMELITLETLKSLTTA